MLKEYIKNNKKIILGLILMLALLKLFALATKDYDMLETYLKVMGFSAKDNINYEMRLNNLEMQNEKKYLNFNIDDKLLKEIIIEEDEGISRTFSADYNNTANTISYTYEISNDKSTIIVNGQYNKTKKTCKVLISDYRDNSQIQKSMCNNIANKIEEFWMIIDKIYTDDFKKIIE